MNLQSQVTMDLTVKKEHKVTLDPQVPKDRLVTLVDPVLPAPKDQKEIKGKLVTLLDQVVLG